MHVACPSACPGAFGPSVELNCWHCQPHFILNVGMNKFCEKRRNEFHATCDDIPVFQLGAVVFRHGFVAQGDGWDSNRSILARAYAGDRATAVQRRMASGACQSRRERESATPSQPRADSQAAGTGMIAVWQGNEAWEVQHACKRVLLVGWTTPEEKSVARAEDEGERADPVVRRGCLLAVNKNQHSFEAVLYRQYAGRMPDLADWARHAVLSGQHQLSPAVTYRWVGGASRRDISISCQSTAINNKAVTNGWELWRTGMKGYEKL
ncbi:uncharacterized protein K441DRAFT_701657 [Cenococcum geophilum 1.58]|uniref:Uncharacterized protein n=1 Tax=Cenococcum geophilum 1.58 TaxID=794803 RepID=A0ACC8EKQ1_9PEZI|nr:hypothetical protein K441DRAFT_701657 [Cenococcum geophilum 1.58]